MISCNPLDLVSCVLALGSCFDLFNISGIYVGGRFDFYVKCVPSDVVYVWFEILFPVAQFLWNVSLITVCFSC